MVSDDYDKEKSVIELRIASLRANRNFFVALFTIESAILAIFIRYFACLSIEFTISVIFLFGSILLILFGSFSLTDSIHFYSKYLEYRYIWKEKVHGIAYKSETKNEKATKDYKRALEADDVGYYFLKLSLLLFLYFLISLVLNVKELQVEVRVISFILVGLLVTYVLIRCYKATHRKTFSEAFKDFFRRKSIFEESD